MTNDRMPKKIRDMNAKEKTFIKELGERMGWGRVMQLSEECWRESSHANGFKGSELTVGPCGFFMVPCPHTIKDDHGHCDICCGSGRITKGVLDIITAQTRGGDWRDIESAPRDGTVIDLWSKGILGQKPHRLVGMLWQDGSWKDEISGLGYTNISHWMPLPAPPSSSKTDAGEK